MKCWEGVHILYIVASILILIAYLPLCFRYLQELELFDVHRMVTVDGDLNKVAFYWWRTWKHDKQDVRNLHALSKRTVWNFFEISTNFTKLRFERAYLFTKLILIAVTSAFFTNTFPVTATALLLSAVVTLVTNFYDRMFHSNLVNYLVFINHSIVLSLLQNVALTAVFGWTIIVSILMVNFNRNFITAIEFRSFLSENQRNFNFRDRFLLSDYSSIYFILGITWYIFKSSVRSLFT